MKKEQHQDLKKLENRIKNLVEHGMKPEEVVNYFYSTGEMSGTYPAKFVKKVFGLQEAQYKQLVRIVTCKLGFAFRKLYEECKEENIVKGENYESFRTGFKGLSSKV